MDNLSLFKCKNCGSALDIRLAKDYVVECQYCHTPWSVPRKETTPEALKYLHDGDVGLDTCKFDDAYSLFQKAAELNSNEPEAFFGMALATFKIQYLQDSYNNKLQPICHEVTKKKFLKDKNYLKALSLATAAQRTEYERRAGDVDYICDQFYRIAQSGLRYDSFICVKVTDDETGDHTADSKDADYIYRMLKEHGYSPFYSEYEIRNKTGTDYEAHILYALYSAECMLIVCNNDAYLRTKWVKNEYTRFLKLIREDAKDSDSITIIFNGTPIEKLPGRQGKIQGINFNLREADNKILEFVENHTPTARQRKLEEEKKRQAEEKKRQEEEENIRLQMEQLNQRLQNLQSAPASGGAMATVQSLLTRAEQELSAGGFDRASMFYDRVLEADPFNGYAWWGMMLISFNVSSEDDILKTANYETLDDIKNNRNFLNASRYADDILKTRIQKFMSAIESPKRWWDRFLKEMGVQDENEILLSISAEKIESVNNNRNFLLAKQYAASGEFAGRINEFEKGLYSPETNWRLFLQSYNIRNESELLSRLTPEMLQNIEADILYRTATREAKDELKERLDAFTLQLHSGQLWWQKFLESRSATSGEEILERINVNAAEEIEQNALYQNAVRYATGEFRETMQKFSDELHSGDLWWRHFLKDFVVQDEEEIFESIQPETVDKIEANQNFQYACRYAKAELSERIEKFTSKLKSADLWWKIFLKHQNLQSENEIFDDPKELSPQIIERIESDRYFQKAKEYAEGEMAESIDRFLRRLKSGELWWTAFLRRMGVESEEEFFQNLAPDSLDQVESSDYFRNARKYAEETYDTTKSDNDLKILNGVVKFNENVHSFEPWWTAFLAHQQVTEVPDLLKNYTYATDDRVLNDPYLKIAERFANNEQKEIITNLNNDIGVHHKLRAMSEKYWAAVLKTHHAKTVRQLNQKNESIKKDPNLLKAIEKANESASVDLVEFYNKVAEQQEMCARHNRHKKMARSVAGFFKGLLSVIFDVIFFVGGLALFGLCFQKCFTDAVFLGVDWGKCRIPAMLSGSAICLFGLIYQLFVFRHPKRAVFAGLVHLAAFGLFWFNQWVISSFVAQDSAMFVLSLETALSVGIFYLRMGVKPTHAHYHVYILFILPCFEGILWRIGALGGAVDTASIMIVCAAMFFFMLTLMPRNLYGNISRFVFCIALLVGFGLAAIHMVPSVPAGEEIAFLDLCKQLFAGMNSLWTCMYLGGLIALTVVVTILVHKVRAKIYRKKFPPTHTTNP